MGRGIPLPIFYFPLNAYGALLLISGIVSPWNGSDGNGSRAACHRSLLESGKIMQMHVNTLITGDTVAQPFVNSHWLSQ